VIFTLKKNKADNDEKSLVRIKTRNCKLVGADIEFACAMLTAKIFIT